MKLLKVAAGVLNQTPLDWIRNRDNIVAAIEAAREQNVTVLCLPELCISGYPPKDLLERRIGILLISQVWGHLELIV